MKSGANDAYTRVMLPKRARRVMRQTDSVSINECVWEVRQARARSERVEGKSKREALKSEERMACVVSPTI